MREIALTRFNLLATLLLAAPLHLSAQRSTCTGPATVTPLAPELSAPGSLFRGILSPGGNELLYFKRVSNNGEDYRIFRSRRSGLQWSPGEQLVIGSGGHSDLYPTVSADGSRLVFSSYRPLPGADSARHNAHLWIAERTGGGWGTPAPIAAANTPGYYHAGPLMQRDGSVRFSRLDPDYRNPVVMVTTFRNGSYVRAEPVTDPAFWRNRQRDYVYHGGVLSPDGQLAIVLASRIDSATQRPAPPDAWYSRRANGEWQALIELDAGVNTPGDENFFSFTPDGCSLIFTRDYSSFHMVSVVAATGSGNRSTR